MEIQKHISTASWMDLSWQVRTQLVKDLNIPKSRDVVLQDNVVLTDGRTQADINQAITIKSLPIPCIFVKVSFIKHSLRISSSVYYSMFFTSDV